MRNVVSIFALVVALGGTSGAQEQWVQVDLAPEGMEYRLFNNDGVAIARLLREQP